MSRSERTIHKLYDDDLFEIMVHKIKSKNLREEELIELASHLIVPLFKGNLSSMKNFLDENWVTKPDPQEKEKFATKKDMLNFKNEILEALNAQKQ